MLPLIFILLYFIFKREDGKQNKTLIFVTSIFYVLIIWLVTSLCVPCVHEIYTIFLIKAMFFDKECYSDVNEWSYFLLLGTLLFSK